MHEMLYNPQVIDVEKVDAALNARNAQDDFKGLMDSASYLLTLSFLIVLPSMAMMMYALWRLLGGLQRITGLTLDEILKQPPEKK